MQNIKILIVDDQPVFRQGLASLLGTISSEFNVVGDVSGMEEAVPALKKLKPDIVIMDINMEGGNGIALVRFIRTKYPKVKPLVLSDSNDQGDLYKVIKAGAFAYLLKKVKLDELADSIRLVLAGNSVLTSTLLGKLVAESARNEEVKYAFLLTKREREILNFASQGYSNQEIAERCYISLATVKSHLRNIMKKLQVNNRTKAVSLATTTGLLED
jgi:DNA-binding NarL/FixJ family response regulator